MRFAIGQKVVCIAPHPEWENRGCIIPRVGGIYTVRGYDDVDGILLEEIVNDPPPLYSIDVATGEFVAPAEDSFWPHRFRPLIEHKTMSKKSKPIIPRHEPEVIAAGARRTPKRARAATVARLKEWKAAHRPGGDNGGTF